VPQGNAEAGKVIQGQGLHGDDLTSDTRAEREGKKKGAGVLQTDKKYVYQVLNPDNRRKIRQINKQNRTCPIGGTKKGARQQEKDSPHCQHVLRGGGLSNPGKEREEPVETNGILIPK